MISFSISGACNGCDNIDLRLNEYTFFLDDKLIKHYILLCSHSTACRKLQEESKKNLTKAREIEARGDA